MLTRTVVRAASRASNLYHQARRLYAPAVCWLSAIHFHAFWKPEDYPRQFREDWSRIQAYLKNPVLCRVDEPLFSTLLLASDPTAVPWDETHASTLHRWPAEDHLCRGERKLRRNRPFLLVLFGSLLKRTGDLVNAERLYRDMLDLRVAPYEALIGLADIRHLLANWRQQLSEYKARQIYPSKSVLPVIENESDRLSDIETFDLEEAIDLYQRAVAIRPHGAFARVHLSRALVDANKHPEAVRALEQAASCAPHNRLIQLKWAYLRALSGDVSAFSDIRTLYEYDPDMLWEFGDLKRVELAPLTDAARRLGRRKRALLPPDELKGVQTVVHGGNTSAHTFTITYPSVEFAEFDNARNLGWGTTLVEERFIVAESKHLSLPELPLFSRPIIAWNDKHVLVGTRLESCEIDTAGAIFLPGAAFNYYHWIVDALAALILLSKKIDLSKYALLVDTPLLPFQEDALKLAFGDIPPLLPLPRPWPRYRFSKILHLPYPARLNVPHPASIAAVRRAISKHHAKPKPGKRVYITRSKVAGRRTTNEQAISEMLLDHGFTVFDPVGKSLADQIEFFKDVEIVVAPAGAALTNLIFAPTQTRVIIITSGHHNFETFTSMLSAIGQVSWSCLGRGATFPNPFFVWSIFELTIDVNDLLICVEQAIASVSGSASEG